MTFLVKYAIFKAFKIRKGEMMKAEIARMVSYIFSGLFFLACVCKGIDPEGTTVFSQISWVVVVIFVAIAIISAIMYEKFLGNQFRFFSRFYTVIAKKLSGEQTLETIKSGNVLYWTFPRKIKGLM